MEKAEILKEKVLYLLDALNCEDFGSAEECLDENFEYHEFLFTYNGADTYLHRLKRKKSKFLIDKVFADDENVCVFYTINTPDLEPIFGCGLYGFNDEKIATLNLLADHVPIVVPSEDGSPKEHS